MFTVNIIVYTITSDFYLKTVAIVEFEDKLPLIEYNTVGVRYNAVICNR